MESLQKTKQWIHGFGASRHPAETGAHGQNDGLLSRARQGACIPCVHSAVIGDDEPVRKELWLGRSYYSYLLDLSEMAIKTGNCDRAEDALSEWHGCFSSHGSEFEMLAFVFGAIYRSFREDESVAGLNVWMYFLKQQGLVKGYSEDDVSSSCQAGGGKPAWLLHGKNGVLFIASINQKEINASKL